MVSSRFFSSPSLLSLLLWLAAGTGTRSCCMFFQRLDDASSPPPFPKVFSPQIVWLFVRVSFFSLVPALLALREKEQANRAHHTSHVYVIVMCSGFVFAKRIWPLFF